MKSTRLVMVMTILFRVVFFNVHAQYYPDKVWEEKLASNVGIVHADDGSAWI